MVTLLEQIQAKEQELASYQSEVKDIQKQIQELQSQDRRSNFLEEQVRIIGGKADSTKQEIIRLKGIGTQIGGTNIDYAEVQDYATNLRNLQSQREVFNREQQESIKSLSKQTGLSTSEIQAEIKKGTLQKTLQERGILEKLRKQQENIYQSSVPITEAELMSGETIRGQFTESQLQNVGQIEERLLGIGYKGVPIVETVFIGAKDSSGYYPVRKATMSEIQELQQYQQALRLPEPQQAQYFTDIISSKAQDLFTGVQSSDIIHNLDILPELKTQLTGASSFVGGALVSVGLGAESIAISSEKAVLSALGTRTGDFSYLSEIDILAPVKSAKAQLPVVQQTFQQNPSFALGFTASEIAQFEFFGRGVSKALNKVRPVSPEDLKLLSIEQEFGKDTTSIITFETESGRVGKAIGTTLRDEDLIQTTSFGKLGKVDYSLKEGDFILKDIYSFSGKAESKGAKAEISLITEEDFSKTLINLEPVSTPLGKQALNPLEFTEVLRVSELKEGLAIASLGETYIVKGEKLAKSSYALNPSSLEFETALTKLKKGKRIPFESRAVSIKSDLYDDFSFLTGVTKTGKKSAQFSGSIIDVSKEADNLDNLFKVKKPKKKVKKVIIDNNLKQSLQRQQQIQKLQKEFDVEALSDVVSTAQASSIKQKELPSLPLPAILEGSLLGRRMKTGVPFAKTDVLSEVSFDRTFSPLSSAKIKTKGTSNLDFTQAQLPNLKIKQIPDLVLQSKQNEKTIQRSLALPSLRFDTKQKPLQRTRTIQRTRQIYRTPRDFTKTNIPNIPVFNVPDIKPFPNLNLKQKRIGSKKKKRKGISDSLEFSPDLTSITLGLTQKVTEKQLKRQASSLSKAINIRRIPRIK